MRSFVSAATLVVALMGLAGPGAAAPFLPVFDSSNFSNPTNVDHPYFPLVRGRSLTYLGVKEEDGESVVEWNTVYVTKTTRTVFGIDTVVVRDTAYEGDLVVEFTDDWYAQDDDGNVWYMGEFATNREYDDDGNLIGTNNEGSWEAGVDGALPGYIMPAVPFVDFNYYQEYYLGEAEDEAVFKEFGVALSQSYGDFIDVWKILELSALAPGAEEFKYFAPGLGLVRVDEAIDEFGEPEFIVELVSVTPEPATHLLIGLGVGALFMAGRRRRHVNRVSSPR